MKLENLKHPLSHVALFGPLLLLQKQGICDRIFLFQNSFSQNGENLSQEKKIMPLNRYI
jgi:hypothetical protein